MKQTSMLLVALLVPFVATACKRDVGQSHITVSELSGASPSADVTDANLSEVIVGQVVDTMDAGQYTYVQIATGADKVWAAAPKCTVQVGDQLAISTAMPMRNWASKTLDREFELVYFVNAFEKPEDGTALPGAGHGTTGPSTMSRSAGPTNVDVGTVAKAEGGMTVAEIHAQKEDLAAKEVKVRGKVTKYNTQIMGKNWLHVQDGSGDSAAGTHDLTVTTTADTKVGDTVLVTGKVQLNKDFGFGYKYDIIIEDAEVVVE